MRFTRRAWTTFSLAFGLTCATALAQDTLRCQLLDTLGAPVPYANVYAPALGQGAVADGDGHFALALDAGVSDDTLLLSCVGFAERRIPVAEARSACPLTLSPAAYGLSTAVVRAGGSEGKSRVYGVRAKHTLGSAALLGDDDVEEMRAFEIGNVMKAEGTWHLQEIRTYLKGMRGDTITMEFTVYGYADGAPTDPLHTRRLLHELTEDDKKGPIAIDVAEAGIWGEWPFFVAFRILDGLERGTSVKFPARIGRAATAYRAAGEEWSDIPIASVALSARVLRYGRVYPLD